jgi:hypothetical protein
MCQTGSCIPTFSAMARVSRMGTRWWAIGVEVDAEAGAGGLGEALKRPGRGLDPPAFAAGDRRLGRAHRRGHLRLGHPGPTAALIRAEASC